MMLIWLMVAIFIYLDYEKVEEGDDGDRRDEKRDFYPHCIEGSR